MEPISRENSPEQEDIDFIVDDGYNHDVDPDYIPSDSESVSVSVSESVSESESESESVSVSEMEASVEKIKSEFYFNKINVDYKKDCIKLIFINCKIGSGDYVCIFLPIPIRFDEEWFSNLRKENFIMNVIKPHYSKEFSNDLDSAVLYNSEFSSNRTQEYISDFKEKMKSGYFTNVISIVPDSVEAFIEKDYIELLFISYLEPDEDGDQYETGGDYVHLYLPFPITFDDEWIEKYRKVNLTVGTIENCYSEGYIKSDLKII